MTTPPDDVPSPIDLRLHEHAAQWASEAMAKRPERTAIFEAIAQRLRDVGAVKVLELGSGPGFLASHLRSSVPQAQLTLLDFSAAMHELARERLGTAADGVRFLTRSFRDHDWADGLASFDAVVTTQAVHELRHKWHAPALHGQVLATLRDGGEYLVCDHFAGDGGMKNAELFMTVEEQALALRAAGFTEVEQVVQLGTLMLHRARAAGP